MAPTTTVRDFVGRDFVGRDSADGGAVDDCVDVDCADRRGVVAAVEPDSRGERLVTGVTESGGTALDVLVDQVLDDPDDVSDEVLAEAVRGLEARAGVPLGDTATDTRVVLQRRFGRAVRRSGSSTSGA